MTEKALDPDVIEQLNMLVDEDDPDFLTELFEGYLETTESALKELEEAVSEASPIRVVTTAHTQKGASGNIGAKNMAELFKKLEQMGREESIENATKIITDLEKEFQNVKEEIKAYSN